MPYGLVTTPGWVFAVVWPILYMLLGVAINICKSDTRKLSLLLSLVIILNAWWVSFGNRCAPILSFTSILTILLFTCNMYPYI
jgi:tryptophan-rich sensory protein